MQKGNVKVVVIMILCIFVVLILLGGALWYLVVFKDTRTILPVPPIVGDVAPSLKKNSPQTIQNLDNASNTPKVLPTNNPGTPSKKPANSSSTPQLY